ncbi:phage terminase small subunit P27 family [Acuticoccus sediminis]|uniref:Phage terminase small subunit P27 family n=1 Tax=Acuticoccus sediminis TaxID=2184697 RepID=A0A8B2NPA1_9HYPH|nr:P27 family phage terminase small subunit [Acuticoccus sediminis]RAH97613.1 phage terminase small subunit P27 family [Acuticoccus sediminis]
MSRGRKPNPKSTESGLLKRTPSVPAWFPAEAKSVWRRVAKRLIERRVLAESDLDTLASYCVATANIEIITSGRGDKTINGTLNQAQQIQRQLAAELGLSPTSRSKVGTEPSDNDEDLSALGL